MQRRSLGAAHVSEADKVPPQLPAHRRTAAAAAAARCCSLLQGALLTSRPGLQTPRMNASGWWSAVAVALSVLLALGGGDWWRFELETVGPWVLVGVGLLVAFLSASGGAADDSQPRSGGGYGGSGSSGRGAGRTASPSHPAQHQPPPPDPSALAPAAPTLAPPEQQAPRRHQAGSALQLLAAPPKDSYDSGGQSGKRGKHAVIQHVNVRAGQVSSSQLAVAAGSSGSTTCTDLVPTSSESTDLAAAGENARSGCMGRHDALCHLPPHTVTSLACLPPPSKRPRLAPCASTLLPFSSPSRLRTALQPPLCLAPSRTAAASATPAPTSTLAACSATATCGTRHRFPAGGYFWDCRCRMVRVVTPPATRHGSPAARESNNSALFCSAAAAAAVCCPPSTPLLPPPCVSQHVARGGPGR